MSLALCRFSIKARLMSNAAQKAVKPTRLPAVGGDWQASGRKVLRPSEQELRAELHDARGVGARYLPEARGVNRRVGIAELRVVEGVEGLRPEFEPDVLLNLER